MCPVCEFKLFFYITLKIKSLIFSQDKNLKDISEFVNTKFDVSPHYHEPCITTHLPQKCSLAMFAGLFGSFLMFFLSSFLPFLSNNIQPFSFAWSVPSGTSQSLSHLWPLFRRHSNYMLNLAQETSWRPVLNHQSLIHLQALTSHHSILHYWKFCLNIVLVSFFVFCSSTLPHDAF